VLFAAGYDAEAIADMSPEERAAEARDAADQGVTAIDPQETASRLSEMQPVQPPVRRPREQLRLQQLRGRASRAGAGDSRHPAGSHSGS